MVRHDTPLNFAIVGCGRIARQHAAAINGCKDIANLVGVVDADRARAVELAESFGAPSVHDDLDAVLARADVDAIVLCTPNALHAEHAIRALAAGKHVLVESRWPKR